MVQLNKNANRIYIFARACAGVLLVGRLTWSGMVAANSTGLTKNRKLPVSPKAFQLQKSQEHNSEKQVHLNREFIKSETSGVEFAFFHHVLEEKAL